jgi:hypothetical protein
MSVAAPLRGNNGRGERDEGREERGETPTFELAEHAVHGAGAATAGHGDIEFVGVCVRHDWSCVLW